MKSRDRRASQIIPAYLFDEHNEAFYYWHKARHEGFLNRALDIFHIDAHSDMGKVEKLRNSLYGAEKDSDSYLAHYRAIAYKDMNIANFMIPAVLNGIARNIYFIYPAWRKYKRQRKKLNVASAFAEGSVLKHDIKIVESEKRTMQLAYPDLTEYAYVTTDIEHIPAKREVLLDIDLDYFACTDSITHRMSYELAITADQYNNRKQFMLDNPSMQYSGLEIDFARKGKRFFAKVHFKKGADREHLPTATEIRREVDKVVNCLREKKIQPAAVTICRSSVSGYCPPEYFQLIEDYVLQQLQSGFPAIRIAG